MIGEGRTGWWVTGIVGAVILTSIGYGMGRRAALRSLGPEAGVTPAGAPLPTIQIEPIQPQEELAAIHASGTGAESAAPAIAPPAATPSGTATAAVASAVEDSSRVREVQLALRAAGYDPGPADGRMGPRTRAAIRDFQVANGLQADGKVGPRTWGKLETFLGKQPQSGSAASAD